MILQALTEYYYALSKAKKVPPMGLEYVPIRWVIVINTQGEFIDLEDYKDTNESKNRGQEKLVIASVERSSDIKSNHLWDKVDYVLGWGYDKTNKKTIKETSKNLEAFVNIVNSLTDKFPNNREFNAVSLFYTNKQYSAQTKLWKNSDIRDGEYLSFRIVECENIVASNKDLFEWSKSELESTVDAKAKDGIDMITGNRSQTIVLTHPTVSIPSKLKGGLEIKGKLVSFQKNSGYDSYGETQGFNAPVSRKTALAYTAALNYLGRNDQAHAELGEIHYVFWNSEAGYTKPESTFKEVAFGSSARKESAEEPVEEPTEDDNGDFNPKKRGKKSENVDKEKEEDQRHYHEVMDTFRSFLGAKNATPDWDSSHRFHVLGLKGEQGRIAVRFWRQGTIREIFQNLYQHLQDFNIENNNGQYDEENPPLRNLLGILGSAFPRNARDVITPPANLVQSFLESIINGTPYPLSLQQAIIGRVAHEGKVTELRAATLKACINRKIRTYHYNIKELAMALDTENPNVAYLCGRLLAVLDEIQRKSLGGTVNSTIIDRFYGSASTRPNTVFPRLIALSQHHLSKLRKEKPGFAVTLDRKLEEIISLIDVHGTAFPSVFSLDEQSLFAVGYYHQKHAPWGKTDNDQATLSDQSENI